jgi:hypothetical protein
MCRIQLGSLVAQLPGSGPAITTTLPTLLCGSADGSLVVFATLPNFLFKQLNLLQDSLRKHIQGVAWGPPAACLLRRISPDTVAPQIPFVRHSN